MRTHLIALAASALFALTAGCSKSDDAPKSNPTPVASTPPPPATTAAPVASAAPVPSATAKAGPPVEIQIASVANTMAYDKTKLSVPAGSTVHLVLKNNATMATLPHNWVLVKPGTEASVAAAGMKLGEAAGYFDVRDKDALAHTDLAKPGQTAEVTFGAPPPGDYPYICTFPGHFMMMKGVLTVTP
jgi:azurin